MGNLESFNDAMNLIRRLHAKGIIRLPERDRATKRPHGHRKAQRRRVTKAAKVARKLNRPNKRGRKLAPRGREFSK